MSLRRSVNRELCHRSQAVTLQAGSPSPSDHKFILAIPVAVQCSPQGKDCCLADWATLQAVAPCVLSCITSRVQSMLCLQPCNMTCSLQQASKGSRHPAVQVLQLHELDEVLDTGLVGDAGGPSDKAHKMQVCQSSNYVLLRAEVSMCVSAESHVPWSHSLAKPCKHL